MTTTTLITLGANGDAVLSAVPGRVRRIALTLYTGGGGFVFLCDKAAQPPTALSRAFTPIPFPPAAAGSPSNVDIDFDGVGGLPYAVGLVLGISTTSPAYGVPAGVTGEVAVTTEPP